MTYLQLLLMRYIEDQHKPEQGVFFENGLVRIQTKDICSLMSEEFWNNITYHPKLKESYK